MIESRHLEWILARQDLSEMFDGPLMLMGESPYTPGRLARLLGLAGIETAELSSDHWILVLGHDDWDKHALSALVAARAHDLLYCYSQEMLLTALLSGHDPYCASAEDVQALGAGHPALDYLSVQGFDWPQVLVSGRESERGVADATGGWGTGVLGALGYSVAENGPNHHKRRRILARAFEADLPKKISSSDRELWGRSESSERLHQIASSIAHYHNLYIGKYSANARSAVRWRSDLDWLKKTYFGAVKRFNWPTASSR
jgi:hypothetical protein